MDTSEEDTSNSQPKPALDAVAEESTSQDTNAQGASHSNSNANADAGAGVSASASASVNAGTSIYAGDDEKTPVVTFVESPRTHHETRARSSSHAGMAETSAGRTHGHGHVHTIAKQVHSAHMSPSAHVSVVAQGDGGHTGILGRKSHHKTSPRLQAEEDRLSKTKSYSTLEHLKPENQPMFSPGAVSVSFPEGAAHELHGSRGLRPEEAMHNDEYDGIPVLRKNSVTAHQTAPADDRFNESLAPVPEISQSARRERHSVYSTMASSSTESTGRVSSESEDSLGLENIWFQRARTFSALGASSAYADGADKQHSASRSLSGSAVSLPHLPNQLPPIKEKSNSDSDRADNDADNDVDGPAYRLGPEMTNDLRNIQLTFSRQPTHGSSAHNPLKHLLRSKHNFRALVTYGGYLIPINILLNVILLGRGWLQLETLDEEGRKETVSNPLGYLITSIISLVLIVCSGFSFVLRCLEYNVITTTMTVIITNFVNAVLILASAIMYLKNERPKHPDAKLTGEYYCSYAGAAVALLNAMLLLLDLLVTPGFRFRGSGMSRPQRMLQFNIILIVVWIGIGGYAWSKIEDWTTVESVMFCMVTVTTIGFGNLSPSPGYSRILQLFYGPLGILMFGLMLLNTRNVVIQLTRKRFRLAKREFESKRRKLEKDVKLNQVKRRLAARPVQRTWKTTFTDFLGRVFLSKGSRVRIGIPGWLRNRLENEDTASRHSDLEAGQGSDSEYHHGNNAMTCKSPSAIPHENLTFQSVMSTTRPIDGSNVKKTPSIESESNPDISGLTSRSQQSFSQSVHDLQQQQKKNEPDDQSPFPVIRSYTSASRLSQVRDAISQPGRLDRARNRIDRIRHRKNKNRGANDKELSEADYAGSQGDTDDEIDRYNALHAGRTLQPGVGASGSEGGSEGDSENEQGFRRVITKASAVSHRVRNKARNTVKQNRVVRKISDSAKQLLTAIVINLCFWTATAAIFYAVERGHWNYFDALYFCYVAYTTIGYGDVTPSTTEGNIVFICVIFVAVALETFLVVSAVGYFTELIGRAMKRTRVQKRIMKRHQSLVAYEIRRHIKHPNYNPFGRGEEDRMVEVGLNRLKRVARDTGNILRGRRPERGIYAKHGSDRRQHDESLTQNFIRYATGMDGFGPSDWQPPSPPMAPRTLSISLPKHRDSTSSTHQPDLPMLSPEEPTSSRPLSNGQSTTVTESAESTRSSSEHQ
ncbi:Potassium channel [Coemansia sp. RSA 485]|nr:Potassium channel [Coemansia sp. RSA 485]